METNNTARKENLKAKRGEASAELKELSIAKNESLVADFKKLNLKVVVTKQ